MDVLLKHALATEAMHSVAMEHPKSCDCLTCRAASGDKEARDEYYALLFAEME